MQAKKEPTNFLQPAYNSKLLCELGPLAEFVNLHSEENNSIIASENIHEEPLRRQPLVKMNEPVVDSGAYCRPISEFMEEEPCTSDELGTPPMLKELVSDAQELVEGETFISRTEAEGDKWELYKLPSSILERRGDCFGILPQSPRYNFMMLCG